MVSERMCAQTPRPPGVPVVVIYCHEYGQTWWNEVHNFLQPYRPDYGAQSHALSLPPPVPSAQWGPSSLRRGVGGSEEAVIFMAQELGKLGYWVRARAVIHASGTLWSKSRFIYASCFVIPGAPTLWIG